MKNLITEIAERKAFYHDPEDFEAWYAREVSPKVNELLDFLDTHTCTMSDENSCICESVAQELSDLDYHFPDPKYLSFSEIPF